MMSIEIMLTNIPEIKVIKRKQHFDERGFFTETYNEEEYLDIEIPRFVQDNLSKSSKGVIRGLHWQESPHGQGKLVTCVKGSILDVVVDVRKESSTFGDWVAVELKENDSQSLWVPEGFAHGFQSLEENTLVHYKVTSYWNKESERSLRWNDSKIGIEWRNMPSIVSEKDNAAPMWSNLI
jgi:dTDP-4-dehydrorhamnose 3,5-epimerase